jgi:hypothetical protein
MTFRPYKLNHRFSVEGLAQIFPGRLRRRPPTCNRKHESGSILLVTVFLAGILGLTLGYYLWLVRAQNVLVAESQAWNSALVLAEAGVEEGLAQINVSFGTNYVSSAQANWGLSGPGVYGPRSNSLDTGSYSVVLIATNSGPTLIATGYAASPVLSNGLISRTVQVTTTVNPAFRYALGSGLGISLNGNNVAIDSFDSSNPTYTRKAGADVAATDGLTNSGIVEIYGTLRTGPGVGPNLGGGWVGDLSYHVPNGIQCSQDYSSDFNQQFRPVLPLNTVSFTPPVCGNGTNKYVLNGGNFIINGDLTLGADNAISVVGSGDSVLYVAGNVSMAGPQGALTGASINIAPGCNLLLYVAGPSAALTQVNTAGPASSFQYYGLPSNTSVTWSGNTDNTFIGGIYAPQAQLTLGSGTSFHHHTQYEFQGACMANSITLNGKFNFHYDEALKHTLSPVGFVVTSWREL